MNARSVVSIVRESLDQALGAAATRMSVRLTPRHVGSSRRLDDGTRDGGRRAGRLRTAADLTPISREHSRRGDDVRVPSPPRGDASAAARTSNTGR